MVSGSVISLYSFMWPLRCITLQATRWQSLCMCSLRVCFTEIAKTTVFTCLSNGSHSLLVSFACWLVSQSSIFNRESAIIVTLHTFFFHVNSIGFMINLTARKETARRKFALRCIFSERCSLLWSKYTGYGLRRNNQSILVSKQKEWRYEVLFQVCRYGAACFVHSDDKSKHQ